MLDPKIGGAFIERDPRKPRHRSLVVLNTNRKPATRQWLNEDGIRALRDECARALDEIEGDRANAAELAAQILGHRNTKGDT